jgi:hypothetical protein
VTGTTFTLIEDGRPLALRATRRGSSVRIEPESLTEALGWRLEPRGLCRGSTCIPVRNPAELCNDEGIDIAALAQVLGRPLALDAEAGVAALGHSAAERGAQLDSLEAPDFALPDCDGRLHRLSQQRGKRVLLIAYASW